MPRPAQSVTITGADVDRLAALFPSIAKVLSQLVPEDAGDADTLLVGATGLLHNVVGRVRKDRVDGAVTIKLSVTPCKDGVKIVGKVGATVTAKLGELKAEEEFRSRKQGELFPPEPEAVPGDRLSLLDEDDGADDEQP